MTITLQHETVQGSASIRHRPGLERAGRRTRQDAPSAALLAIALIGIAIVPAAFWGGVVWLVWGWLPAAITALIALFGTTITIGMLRSAGDVETPELLSSNVRHADPATLRQAA